MVGGGDTGGFPPRGGGGEDGGSQLVGLLRRGAAGWRLGLFDAAPAATLTRPPACMRARASVKKKGRNFMKFSCLGVTTICNRVTVLLHRLFAIMLERIFEKIFLNFNYCHCFFNGLLWKFQPP